MISGGRFVKLDASGLYVAVSKETAGRETSSMTLSRLPPGTTWDGTVSAGRPVVEGTCLGGSDIGSSSGIGSGSGAGSTSKAPKASLD